MTAAGSHGALGLLGSTRRAGNANKNEVKCEAAIAAAKVDKPRIVVIALLAEKSYSMKVIFHLSCVDPESGCKTSGCCEIHGQPHSHQLFPINKHRV